jgi:hypothetical protein
MNNIIELRQISDDKAWKDYALELLDSPISAQLSAAFNTYWIEGGHHIREQLSDDAFLVRFLRHMLPRYEGNALTLYRGENLNRWNEGCIGLAWTEDISIATMFARGLNAVHSGGVLIQGTFESAAIISGPNSHSNYLGEKQYTVDPLQIASLTAIASFPPCS